MPLSRAEKEAVVADMAERLGQAQAIVLADYRGLSVAQISALRRALRESGAELSVIRNTLAKLAFEAAEIDPPARMLEGPTAVALLHDDLAGPAKALRSFVKDTEALTIKGGLMGGELLSIAAVDALADLPTRDELLAQFVGLLQAPLQQLVTVLNAPLGDFVGVLNARVQSESGAEG